MANRTLWRDIVPAIPTAVDSDDDDDDGDDDDDDDNLSKCLA